MIEVAARRALIEFEEMNDEHDESKLLREWIGIERLTPPPPPHLPKFVNSLKKDDVLEARVAPHSAHAPAPAGRTWTTRHHAWPAL